MDHELKKLVLNINQLAALSDAAGSVSCRS